MRYYMVGEDTHETLGDWCVIRVFCRLVKQLKNPIQKRKSIEFRLLSRMEKFSPILTSPYQPSERHSALGRMSYVVDHSFFPRVFLSRHFSRYVLIGFCASLLASAYTFNSYYAYLRLLICRVCHVAEEFCAHDKTVCNCQTRQNFSLRLVHQILFSICFHEKRATDLFSHCFVFRCEKFPRTWVRFEFEQKRTEKKKSTISS